MQELNEAADLKQIIEGANALDHRTVGSHVRMMNKDGSFNSDRPRTAWYEKFSYIGLLTMSWPRFFLLLAAVYSVSNILFAACFLGCGQSALASSGPDMGLGPIARCFFFSVQTLSTIGYGAIVPLGHEANALVAVESVYGLLAYALITGLFFARFTRIRARLRFSHLAVICGSTETRALQIRITNWGRSQVIELSARVLFSYLTGPDAFAVRKFVPVLMEPQSIAFMPLAWTLVHSIGPGSPLFDLDAEKFLRIHGEVLVLIKGVDESSGDIVYARTSYTSQEVEFDARYQDMFKRDASGRVTAVDMDRLDKFQREAIRS